MNRFPEDPNLPGKGKTEFQIVLKDSHFKNEPILENDSQDIQRKLVEELIEKINNDPIFKFWNNYTDAIYGTQIKATSKL